MFVSDFPAKKRSMVNVMRKRLIRTLIFPYWRLRRGMTLGAQALITRNGGEVLMVRHGYRPGWHFPGGGVEWRETLAEALVREVEEETGVVITGEPRLFGMYANFVTAPSDHVALFLADEWEQPRVPEPSYEIREQRFFPLADLPDDISPGAQRRLREVFDGAPPSPYW
jgi:ADP-ribose pyrophosphatase YjhB (NUDIX family)